MGLCEQHRELLCIREISGLSGSRVRIKRFYFYYYYYYFIFSVVVVAVVVVVLVVFWWSSVVSGI